MSAYLFYNFRRAIVHLSNPIDSIADRLSRFRLLFGKTLYFGEH